MLKQTLPTPSGPCNVGIFSDSIAYVGADGAPDEISVKIFYPAGKIEGQERYVEAFPQSFKTDDGAVDVQTFCCLNAPVADYKPDYPVVIFSHGYGCHDMINSVLCSDLASCGFVVASIGHAKDASLVRLGDGRTIAMHPEYKAEVYDQSKLAELDRVFHDGIKALDITAQNDPVFVEVSHKLVGLRNDFFDGRLRQWSARISRTADYLERRNAEGPLAGKLRLSAGIGLTGHSFGGAANLYACRADRRFACGVNVDGYSYGYEHGSDVDKPFLFIGDKPTCQILRADFLANSRESYMLVAYGVPHMAFTDVAFLSDTLMAQSADIDPYELHRMLCRYHKAFFTKYLVDRDAPFFDLGYAGTDFMTKAARA